MAPNTLGQTSLSVVSLREAAKLAGQLDKTRFQVARESPRHEYSEERASEIPRHGKLNFVVQVGSTIICRREPKLTQMIAQWRISENAIGHGGRFFPVDNLFHNSENPPTYQPHSTNPIRVRRSL